MRYLSSISLALIVLMALACTATPATPAPTVTPAPTPDVPLLDEETGVDLTTGFLVDAQGEMKRCFTTNLEKDSFQARYVGKDIWIIELVDKDRIVVQHRICTFAFHDKEAHVILPHQDKTAD